MAIKAIVLQRQLTEVGRIRIGNVVEGVNRQTGNTYTRPAKLDTFRFTSISQPLIEKIANAYGGTVQPWTPANGGGSGWEVVTDTTRLPVLVPPQDVDARQYMEQWAGSRCVRRCDGETELLNNTPCVCIATDNMQCKPKTRLSVMLRDIEGLGTWRIESNGWGTATTLPGTAEFLMRQGGYVSATLYLQPRSRVVEVNGKSQTQNWMVPALEVEGITPGELNTGAANGSAAVTAGGPREVAGQDAPAIAAPVRDFVAEIKVAPTRDDVVALWNNAKDVGVPNPAEVEAAAGARVKELAAKAGLMSSPDVHVKAALSSGTLTELEAALQTAQAAGYATALGNETDPVAQAFVGRRRLLLADAEAAGAPEPVVAPSPPPAQQAPPQTQGADALWAQIVAVHPADQTSAIEQEISERFGVLPSQATADQLATFLTELNARTNGQAPTPVTVPASASTDVPF